MFKEETIRFFRKSRTFHGFFFVCVVFVSLLCLKQLNFKSLFRLMDGCQHAFLQHFLSLLSSYEDQAHLG